MIDPISSSNYISKFEFPGCENMSENKMF